VLALATQAHAQATAPSTDAAPKLDRVEITGSMIKRTDRETPTPVSVITRDDIERSGATTLDELMRMDPSVGMGGLDDLSSGNGFAAGTASISMRGMGSAATLVLINGRRISPAACGRQQRPVDHLQRQLHPDVGHQAHRDPGSPAPPRCTARTRWPASSTSSCVTTTKAA
jgi:outer membrane cobalamin receptor